MKQELKTPVLIGVVAVIVVFALYFGFKSANNIGNLDNGQVKYTPGVPPWEEKDPSKRLTGNSPSGSPSGGGNMPGGGPPVISNTGK